MSRPYRPLPFGRLFLDGSPLVLASLSPRRAELLRLVGAPFELVAPGEEPAPHAAAPQEVVMALASEKGVAVAARHPGAWVLGADTLVWCGETMLGKPRDEEEAASMLRRLSGAWHDVYTGLSLTRDARTLTGWECTRVRFRELTDDEIEAYIQTGEPMDKAGAYGIQGYGALWVERVEGCFFNVMGLPLARLAHMFRHHPSVDSRGLTNGP